MQSVSLSSSCVRLKCGQLKHFGAFRGPGQEEEVNRDGCEARVEEELALSTEPPSGQSSLADPG